MLFKNISFSCEKTFSHKFPEFVCCLTAKPLRFSHSFVLLIYLPHLSELSNLFSWYICVSLSLSAFAYVTSQLSLTIFHFSKFSLCQFFVAKTFLFLSNVIFVSVSNIYSLFLECPFAQSCSDSSLLCLSIMGSR